MRRFVRLRLIPFERRYEAEWCDGMDSDPSRATRFLCRFLCELDFLETSGEEEDGFRTVEIIRLVSTGWRDCERKRHEQVCVVGSGKGEIASSPTLKLGSSHR